VSLVAKRVVVLGIGNTLLTDEALGVEAVEQLARAYRVPDDVLLLDGGTSAMDLLEPIAGCDLLIVADAVLSGQAPGSIVRLAGAEVPVFFRTKLSPHQVGLSDLLASLEFSGELPARTVVLGLEPASMGLGLEMTPVVRAQVPALVELIAAELRAAGVPLASGAARS